MISRLGLRYSWPRHWQRSGLRLSLAAGFPHRRRGRGRRGRGRRGGALAGRCQGRDGRALHSAPLTCTTISIRRGTLPIISSKSQSRSGRSHPKFRTGRRAAPSTIWTRPASATAINSMTSPGVWFEDGDAARGRARTCNEFGAQMIRDFPGRFGMFAAIPLPDTDGSLKEIEYALDVLKLDGIGLLTSYAGKLLGDPAFTPVFDEINRRKAVVFVHPTMSCCGNPMPGVSPPTIEFPMDSTRTVTSLLFSGGFARYADTRFIFSHGGGMLLPIVQRLYRAAAQMKPDGPRRSECREGARIRARPGNITSWRASASIRPASPACAS